jgi:hypothetical protein
VSDLSFLDDIPDPVEPARTARAEEELRPPRPTNPPPTRSTSERRKLAALGVSAAWLCTHLCVYGIRQDFHALPTGYVAAQVLLPFVFGACCLAVALAPGKLGLGVGIAVVSGMALLGPLSFWALAMGMPVPHPAGPSPLGFWLGSLLCLDITLSWAAAPLLLVALSLRRAFATQVVWRSTLVGAAIGLLSGGAINLHCSNVDRWHLLAGHAVPVALAALLGAGLVVKWTRA